MLPKYQKIKQEIIHDINTGKFLPGDKIYSEGDLKKKFSVSNTTVVKALNDLVSDGYLIRKQGEGTFVRRNFIHRKVLMSEASPASLSSKTHTAVVEKTLTTVGTPFQDEALAQKLGDASGKERVLQIIQLALINDVPWKIQNRYVLAKKLSTDAIKKIENGGSLSRELISNMAVLPMEMNVGIVNLTINSPELEPIRQHSPYVTKKIDETLAFFDIQKMTYDLNDEPIEYTRSIIDPAYYSLDISTQ